MVLVSVQITSGAQIMSDFQLYDCNTESMLLEVYLFGDPVDFRVALSVKPPAVVCCLCFELAHVVAIIEFDLICLLF